jgi:kinesin family protein C2/C3
MDGFNVCIFAYGQTGTGKTFTMEGIPENRGVNYRALEELFRISEERSSSVAYTFCVSILEVYNEKIRDLLDDNSEQTSKRYISIPSCLFWHYSKEWGIISCCV